MVFFLHTCKHTQPKKKQIMRKRISIYTVTPSHIHTNTHAHTRRNTHITCLCVVQTHTTTEKSHLIVTRNILYTAKQNREKIEFKLNSTTTQCEREKMWKIINIGRVQIEMCVGNQRNSYLV